MKRCTYLHIRGQKGTEANKWHYYHERSYLVFESFHIKWNLSLLTHTKVITEPELDNCSESWGLVFTKSLEPVQVFAVCWTLQMYCTDCGGPRASVCCGLRGGLWVAAAGPAPASHRCTSLSRTELRCRTAAAAGTLWLKQYRCYNQSSFIWKWKITKTQELILLLYTFKHFSYCHKQRNLGLSILSWSSFCFIP